MNARNKELDKTYLSIDTAEDRGFIHRDYIAHCLRWTHVAKRLYERKAWQTARILDVGCGRELPLAKLLYSSKLIPAAYFGVDAGPVDDAEMAKLKGEMAARTTIFEKTNFLGLGKDDVWDQDGVTMPNTLVCFEVLEHVEPRMMMDMLEHMKRLTSNDCRYFVSTPCWNRKDCAANHVNEMLYESLGAAFERHGFIVEHVYGTFASIRDYESLLPDRGQDGREFPSKALFDKLREYYDTNFLSCVFAPLFPAQSRNCLWELRKGKGDLNERLARGQLKFARIEEIQRPWSSSARWEDMAQ